MTQLSPNKEPDVLRLQALWPKIARDIILMRIDATACAYTADDIATTYGLTSEQFIALTRMPAFRELVQEEMARVRELGPRAGHRLRSETLASDLQETLYLRAKDGTLEDKQQIQLLGMLLKSAGLDSPPESQQQQAPQTSVNISFNIPKLSRNSKLQHIMSQPQTNVVEIEA